MGEKGTMTLNLSGWPMPPWHYGAAEIVTYELEELLSTKLRALYQRKKSPDLFDLWGAWRKARPDSSRIVECFRCPRPRIKWRQRCSRSGISGYTTALLATPTIGSSVLFSKAPPS